ncbi:hypothetical protein NMY22_g7742 [Coprinellus aureogranulatus]|nr:hypothetical protein NMY22_g7742 [Coprinellus aureogranulatus]
MTHARLGAYTPSTRSSLIDRMRLWNILYPLSSLPALPSPHVFARRDSKYPQASFRTPRTLDFTHNKLHLARTWTSNFEFTFHACDASETPHKLKSFASVSYGGSFLSLESVLTLAVVQLLICATRPLEKTVTSNAPLRSAEEIIYIVFVILGVRGSGALETPARRKKAYTVFANPTAHTDFRKKIYTVFVVRGTLVFGDVQGCKRPRSPESNIYSQRRSTSPRSLSHPPSHHPLRARNNDTRSRLGRGKQIHIIFVVRTHTSKLFRKLCCLILVIQFYSHHETWIPGSRYIVSTPPEADTQTEDLRSSHYPENHSNIPYSPFAPRSHSLPPTPRTSSSERERSHVEATTPNASLQYTFISGKRNTFRIKARTYVSVVRWRERRRSTLEEVGTRTSYPRSRERDIYRYRRSCPYSQRIPVSSTSPPSTSTSLPIALRYAPPPSNAFAPYSPYPLPSSQGIYIPHKSPSSRESLPRSFTCRNTLR